MPSLTVDSSTLSHHFNKLYKFRFVFGNGEAPSPLQINRTTSMSGNRADLADDVELQQPSDHHNAGQDPPLATAVVHRTTTMINNSAYISPRNLRVQPPADHFLCTCRLCKRRLAPGRDIYMYRGDMPFCSLECREKQVKEDEKKEYKRKKKPDEGVR